MPAGEVGIAEDLSRARRSAERTRERSVAERTRGSVDEGEQSERGTIGAGRGQGTRGHRPRVQVSHAVALGEL